MADKNDLKRKLKRLQDKRQPLVAQHVALAEAAVDDQGEARGFTAEEMEKHEKLATDISGYDASISVIQRQLEDIQLEDADDERTSRAFGGIDPENPAASQEYYNAFKAAILSGGKDLQAAQTLTKDFYNLSGTPPNTGEILVPEELERQIIKEFAKETPLFGLTNVRTISWRRGKFITRAAGGQAAPREEFEGYCFSDPKYGLRPVEVHNFGTMVPVSRELLDDAFTDVTAEIRDVMAEEFATAYEDYSLNGESGNNKFVDEKGDEKTIDLAGRVPKGLMNEDTDWIPERESALAGALTLDDFTHLTLDVKGPSANRGVWFFGSEVYAAVLKLKDADGRPLWQPSLQAGAPNLLLGRPIYQSDFMPGIATGSNAILFGDFKRGVTTYLRRGLTIRRSDHFLFGNNAIAFAGDMRFDVVVKKKKALARLKIK